MGYARQKLVVNLTSNWRQKLYHTAHRLSIGINPYVVFSHRLVFWRVFWYNIGLAGQIGETQITPEKISLAKFVKPAIIES